MKIDFKFDLCIDSAILIDYVSQNSGWKWDDVCDMEREYRHSGEFETSDAYPLIELGEEDVTTFQYWVEKFIEDYKEEIKDKTVYSLFINY